MFHLFLISMSLFFLHITGLADIIVSYWDDERYGGNYYASPEWMERKSK